MHKSILTLWPENSACPQLYCYAIVMQCSALRVGKFKEWNPTVGVIGAGPGGYTGGPTKFDSSRW